jgi:hypothetical protein
MSVFKPYKPFISFRVYMCVAEADTNTANKYNLIWDKEYETWYLDGHKYKESDIYKQVDIKRVLKPFRAFGRHQYFI